MVNFTSFFFFKTRRRIVDCSLITFWMNIKLYFSYILIYFKYLLFPWFTINTVFMKLNLYITAHFYSMILLECIQLSYIYMHMFSLKSNSDDAWFFFHMKWWLVLIPNHLINKNWLSKKKITFCIRLYRGQFKVQPKSCISSALPIYVSSYVLRI